MLFEFWILFEYWHTLLQGSEGEHLPGEEEALIGPVGTQAALLLPLTVFRPRAPLFPLPLLLPATAIRIFLIFGNLKNTKCGI